MGDDIESMGKVRYHGTHLLVPAIYEAESGGLLEPRVRHSCQDSDTPFHFTF